MTGLANPRVIATNGLQLTVHERGDGPAVFLCHGFPELAYSWRMQIDALADAGYRAIAPNQRGYDGSPGPSDPTAYTTRALVEDAIGILDALEIERAVFVGHDWGGMVAWYAAVYHPARVAGVIGLCTPYFPREERSIVEAGVALLGEDWYVKRFQEPDVGEQLLERDVRATFRALMRRRGLSLAEFRQLPEATQRMPPGLFVGDPLVLGEPLFDEEHLQVYVEAFERSGFTGPLNWYRSLDREWREGTGMRVAIDRPALMISAADDFWIPPEAADHMTSLVPDLERHVIPDCGHWIQQERPDDVNALMLDWLDRRGGAVW